MHHSIEVGTRLDHLCLEGLYLVSCGSLQSLEALSRHFLLSLKFPLDLLDAFLQVLHFLTICLRFFRHDMLE